MQLTPKSRRVPLPALRRASLLLNASSKQNHAHFDCIAQTMPFKAAAYCVSALAPSSGHGTRLAYLDVRERSSSTRLRVWWLTA